MGEEDEETIWIPTILFWLWPEGWFYQNERNLTMAYYSCLPNQQERSKQVLRKSTTDRIAKSFGQICYSEPVNPNRYLMSYFGHPFASEINLWAYTQVSVDLARIACALERFRLDQGTYPENLESLAPQYLTTIPHDTITGQPLHFHRTPDGLFLLYSVGWDEVDDGGQPVKKLPQGNWSRLETETGDWVWRYPTNLPAD